MQPAYWTISWFDKDGNPCRVATMDQKEAFEIARSVGSRAEAVYPKTENRLTKAALV